MPKVDTKLPAAQVVYVLHEAASGVVLKLPGSHAAHVLLLLAVG